MLHNLLLGLSTMLLCLMLQLVLVLLVLRYYRNKEYLINNSSFAASLRVVGGVMLLLVIGNLAQIAIWGGMFQFLGEFGNFNAAFYHSAVNFATLGYGDVVMSEKHKLLGPLESLNGILMIGVSTSALMNALQNAMRQTLKALEKREGS